MIIFLGKEKNIDRFALRRKLSNRTLHAQTECKDMALSFSRRFCSGDGNNLGKVDRVWKRWSMGIELAFLLKKVYANSTDENVLLMAEPCPAQGGRMMVFLSGFSGCLAPRFTLVHIF